MPAKSTACHICGLPSANNPCAACSLLLRTSVAVIPVKDEDHSAVIPGKAIWYTEAQARDIFNGTPALRTILASRRVRMPVSVIVSSELPIPGAMRQ